MLSYLFLFFITPIFTFELILTFSFFSIVFLAIFDFSILHSNLIVYFYELLTLILCFLKG